MFISTYCDSCSFDSNLCIIYEPCFSVNYKIILKLGNSCPIKTCTVQSLYNTPRYYTDFALAEPEWGGQVVRTLKNHKNIGLLSNTGSGSPENHKTSKSAINVGR